VGIINQHLRPADLIRSVGASAQVFFIFAASETKKESLVQPVVVVIVPFFF